MHAERIAIAIDGPAGAGKSTVAREVAKRLNYLYIDTGAMYRAVTWKALQAGVDLSDEISLGRLVQQLNLQLYPGVDGQTVVVDGRDVTEAIRSAEVTSRVSRVAAAAVVREQLVALQRQLASGRGVVMDGRDIGSHVLPDAELKIYLTASAAVRAERRFMELPDRAATTLEQLKQEILERDRMDQQREHSPLVCAPDAIVIDSSSLTIEEVVRQIAELSRTKHAGAK